MNYRFFDYKYNISNFSSDLFSTWHIIYILMSFISCILIILFFKKVSHNKINFFMKVLSIASLFLEITKISWESYYDVTTGRGFNIGGLLPLYTCSLFIYCSFLAGWTKGKVKEIAISYLTTIGLIAGAIGVVYCNGLNYYPFWTFGAFYSLFFHYSMLATGIFLLASGYKKLEWSDIIYSWIPIVILSIIATPFNYKYGADYMQIYDASGVPVLHDLGIKMGEIGIRPLFTILMLVLYMPLSGFVILIYKIIIILVSNNKKNIDYENA